MSDDALFALAHEAGLLRDWTDANGRPQQVSPESLRAVLAALGLPCGGDAECADSRARLAEQTAHAPSLVTAEVDAPIALPPLPMHAGRPYRIELEGGGRMDGRLPGGDGPIGLPPIDRPGYHALHVGDDTITLAVAPPRCYGVADALRDANLGGRNGHPRLWGLGVQLYSLRREGDAGLGDYTALATLAARAAEQGASALAISPVHAMFSADVSRFSPYGPSSRLFLNALHIDPAVVLGPDAYAQALADLGPDAAATLARVGREPLVDWPAAGALRLRLLRALYRRFSIDGDHREFDAFYRDGGEALEDHARFEALHATRLAAGESGYWPHWPEALRHPRGAAVASFAADHADEVGFHAFLQWQAARALRAAQRTARGAGMPIGLIADLAVGADNGGSQVWSRQEDLLTGLSVGAPPDAMNSRGQSWGLGAFSPHAMRANGFRAYIEMLRAVFAHAGGVRIDHVLGLGRLWLVPDGAGSDRGAYLKYPIDDLLRLIALESWRHRAIVIGEDLGTVPAGFDERLARAGLLGIRVLFFQRRHGHFLRPSDWSDQAIATTTTHDLPTFAGWWRGADIDLRAKLDLLPVGESEDDTRRQRDGERHQLWRAFVDAGCAVGELPPPDAPPLDAAAGFVAATPAPLAILPVEDALGLSDQPNLPGTVDTHPNWRRRLPDVADRLLEPEAVRRRLARLSAARPRNGDS
ncbi:MAG: 4-alpha-glucanotransferase [Burkholderiaceae bacterium]